MELSREDLDAGSLAFRTNEGRDSMYRVATFLLTTWWGDHAAMVDAMKVLLLSWNAAFYQRRSFDADALESTLKGEWSEIQALRNRSLATFDRQRDGETVRSLFAKLSRALAISTGSRKGVQSPVGTVKALHLLSPAFFPLWDNAIAKAYGCDYKYDAPGAYLRFMEMTRAQVRALSLNDDEGQAVLKRIDEWNYSRFTKRWV